MREQQSTKQQMFDLSQVFKHLINLDIWIWGSLVLQINWVVDRACDMEALCCSGF